MLEKRLYKFSELSALGPCKESLRLWRRDDPAFPKPVHGKFYDIKAIQQYLDKLSNIKQESANHDDVIFGRMAGGKGAREIPTHS